uniref:F-box domain-containing protein n=1 Tax=Oryza nivara TaxID=4536 RepID=A0A0E0GC40_ORYNI
MANKGGYLSVLAPIETTPTIKQDHITSNADLQDRISQLPDDILLAILDGLNVRDAARTSLLSKRWRPLPTMISHLTIDVSDFDPKSMSSFSDDELGRINATVVKATKSILACRKSNEHTISLLSMRFYLRDDDCISFGHTVGHVMATQKVEMIEFTILTEKDDNQCIDDDFIVYGRRFALFFSYCPNTFGGLTGLQLENLRFGEPEIIDVLNTCKRLHYLRLYNCSSGISTFLEVEHLQLSELSIINCRFGIIKLSSLPKLTRMIFGGWIAFQDPLSFGHVPLLESVTLTNVGLSWHNAVKLSKFLSNISIRDLTLDFNSEKVWDHLCETETDDERRKAYSYSENKNADWNASASDFKNHSLSTLVMFGFQSNDENLIRYSLCPSMLVVLGWVSYISRRLVMDAAVNLEDIFLYKRMACEKCKGKNPRPLRYPSTKKQRQALRNRIALGTHSLATIHFPTVLRANHYAKTVVLRAQSRL